jgi:hypothetical protein
MTRLKLCCHAFLFDVSSIIRMFVKLMNMNMCFEQFDYFSYRQIWWCATQYFWHTVQSPDSQSIELILGIVPSHRWTLIDITNWEKWDCRHGSLFIRWMKDMWLTCHFVSIAIAMNTIVAMKRLSNDRSVTDLTVSHVDVRQLSVRYSSFSHWTVLLPLDRSLAFDQMLSSVSVCRHVRRMSDYDRSDDE